jgi:hypothetical protein
MAAVVVAAGAARAQAPSTCWRAVEVGAGAVRLQPSGEGQPELDFVAGAVVTVQVPGTSAPPATIPAGTIVALAENAGQVIVGNGPLELVRGDERYAVPANLRGRTFRLSALKGTRIRLPDAVSDGRLPADTSAEVVLGDAPIEAQHGAPLRLEPLPPAATAAWLDAGALPVTRGGRTLQVELHAPGWTQSDLAAEAFQACFYRAEGEPSAESPMVSLVGVQDSQATLSVLVPEGFDQLAEFYSPAQLQIFGPASGILSDQESVYIGNPVYAFIVSVLVVSGLLVMVAHFLPSDVTVGGVLRKLFSFTIGMDGQPSLSLFQVYIWTALVLVGMFYVFFMSGDLLNISQQVLVLVGLAGVGSISARWISAGAGGKGSATSVGFWGMFVVDGKPDLLRLQLFLFTVAIWIYVAARVFYEQEFPELDPNVLLLMGISNGVYVGGKWAVTGDPTATLRNLHAESDALRQAEASKAAEVSDLEAKVAALSDPATQTAKAGKEDEWQAAAAALAAGKEEHARLTGRREKAEAAFKAEVDRLGKT